MKPFRITAIVLVVIAVLSALGLGWNLRPGKYDGWITTTGTVVDHVGGTYDRQGRGSNQTWAIVVRFTDESGVERQVVSRTSTSRPTPIGETVEVRYPPGQPDHALLGMDMWFWVLFFGIWAGVTTILAIAFTIVSRVATPARRLGARAGADVRQSRLFRNPRPIVDTSEPRVVPKPPASSEPADTSEPPFGAPGTGGDPSADSPWPQWPGRGDG